MFERTLLMGDDQALVGVLGEPSAELRSAHRPGFIMLNAGLLHHVGQNRLSVNLTRSLQRLGFYALRFDLSGIGDSLSRRGELSFQERSVSEIQEAIDYLQQTKGIEKFVLCGLCTGADNAFRAAVADSRVAGIVTLEGYAYSTAEYKKRKYLKKALSVSAWKNKISKLTGTGGNQDEAGEQEQLGDVSYHWKLPPMAQMESHLRGLIDRRVRMLMVFAGNNGRYNYPGQFADAFPSVDFQDLLRESRYDKSDHNFSMASDRERLYGEIGDWLDSWPD